MEVSPGERCALNRKKSYIRQLVIEPPGIEINKAQTRLPEFMISLISGNCRKVIDGNIITTD